MHMSVCPELIEEVLYGGLNALIVGCDLLWRWLLAWTYGLRQRNRSPNPIPQTHGYRQMRQRPNAQSPGQRKMDGKDIG